MSAREAYIAGRSGGSRPSRSSSPSSLGQSRSEEREQQAYDAGRQERERAQTIRDEGIGGLSQEQQDQAKTIAEQTGKDPYNTLTKEEKDALPSFQQEQKPNIFSGIVDFYNAYKDFGGIFGLPVSVLRLIREPRASQFSDPNALAIIRSLFTDEQGNVNQKLLEGYYDDYKDIIEEGIQDRGVGSLDAAQRSSLLTGDFDDFKNLIMSSSPTGIEGMESERRLDPVNYVIDDGKINVPQTTGQAIDFVNTLNFDDIEKAYSEGKISKEQRTRLGQVLEESRALANEARSREARDIGNMQSPAFAPPTQPGTQPPGTQPPGTQPPGTPPIPFPVATGAGITPFNINQFYASLPQYTQQGIMSPNLAQYFQNLQAFPRIV